MNRSRLKLVPKRKPQQNDELSFMPAYRQQAKYLMLADKFLALDKTEKARDDVVLIEKNKSLSPKKKAA